MEVIMGAIEGLTIVVAVIFCVLWRTEKSNAEWSRAGWDQCGARYHDLQREFHDREHQIMELKAQLGKVRE